jgi:hypothetical protein
MYLCRSALKALMASVWVLVCLHAAHAAGTYDCTIRNTLAMNDAGQFVAHAWAANYQNRKFFVDRATGEVIGTTALKERLNNFDASHRPRLLNKDDSEAPFVALTQFANTGRYALLQIDDYSEFKDVAEKPYFYHTSIGMILTGTCVPGAQ